MNVGFGSVGEHANTYNKNNEVVTWGKRSYTAFGGGYSYLYSPTTLLGLDINAKSYDDFYVNDTLLTPQKTTFVKIGDTSLKASCKFQF